MLNLPNSLTLVRILTIPFFLVLLSSRRYMEAFWVFVLGAVTDALDGAVARLTSQATPLGAYLDPVADKLLVMSSYAMLALIEAVPLWLAVLVVSRDVIILFGYVTVSLLLAQRPKVEPSLAGKLNTLFQLFTVGTVVAALYRSGLVPPVALEALFLATAATTVASGFQYVYRGLVWLQKRAATFDRAS
jgi:cardiolipin synthase